MNDLDERLVRCFEAVLPSIKREELEHVTMKSTAGWDSMVTITLVSLIEESFGVQTQPEDIEHLTSFQSIRSYLEKRAAA